MLWTRDEHKSFCKSGDNSPLKLQKDAISRIIHSMSLSLPVLVPLKNYVRTVLKLDDDPLNGVRNLVRFTCTVVNDLVRSSPDAPEKIMLQISRVEMEPSGANEVIVQRESQGRESDGTVHASVIFQTNVPGARAPVFLFIQLFPLMFEKMPIIAEPSIWVW